MTSPRFAVDRMLGRLATWLRLMGLDTVYGANLTGRSLARRARAERRIVLTRDTHLMREKGIDVLFIRGDDFRGQVRQVLRAYGIDPYAGLLSRCSHCNRPIESISATEAAKHVPAYVAQTATCFMRCPCCRRIYWPGTHAERIRAEIAAIEAGPTSIHEGNT